MRLLTLALILAWSAPARADFLQDLTAKFPQTKGAVVKKAFGDFYSVVQGTEVVYINKDLSILMKGEVLDLRTNRSLTSALQDENRPKFNAADLLEADAIRMGTGSRRMFVFSDPHCGYCRRLQGELVKVKNVSVFLLPLPASGMQSDGAAVTQSIWCASNPVVAWNDYLLRGAQPAPKACPNPLERNIALAAKYQIKGTPALVFEDGSVLPGAVSAAVIEARLAKLEKK